MENQNLKYGNVQKCPQCGAPVEPLAVVCSTCGYEFRNVEALRSSQKLADKIEAINLAYRDKGQGVLGFNETKKFTEITETIKNFPIPTTKEDLLDFAVTMQSRWKNEGYGFLAQSYKAKYDECINKIKILFANDPSFAGILEQANKDKRGLSKSGKTMLWLAIAMIVSIALMIAIVVFAQ